MFPAIVPATLIFIGETITTVCTVVGAVKLTQVALNALPKKKKVAEVTPVVVVPTVVPSKPRGATKKTDAASKKAAKVAAAKAVAKHTASKKPARKTKAA